MINRPRVCPLARLRAGAEASPFLRLALFGAWTWAVLWVLLAE